MGLFGITLKKLESIPSDLWHDAFGGGQPAPQNGGQPQGGRGPVQLSAPSFGQAPQQQQNPATSPALMPPPQQQNKKPGVIYDAFHNPVTDFVGKDIVKPLVSAPLQFGKEALAVPGAIGREIQNKPITDIQQQTFGTTDPMRIGEKIAGSTIGTGLTVAAPGIEGALAGTVPKLAVDAGIGTGFGASSAAASGGNLKQVAEGAATGGVGAGALGAAARVAAPAFRAAGQEILDHIRTSPDENPFMAPTQAPAPQTPRLDTETTTSPAASSITPAVKETTPPAVPGEPKTVNPLVAGLGNKVTVLRKIGTPSSNELADKVVGTDQLAQDLRAGYRHAASTALELNDKEFQNLGNVIEHGASPENARVAQAAAEHRALAPQVLGDYQATGANVGEVANHFPRDYSGMPKKGTQDYNQTVRNMVATGKAKDVGQAVQLLNRFQSQAKVNPGFFGNFDLARMDMPGYNYTKAAYEKYLNGAAQKTAEASHFGPNGEVAHQLVGQVAQENGDAALAHKAVSNYLRDAGAGKGKALATVRGVYGAARLGKASLSHAGQTTNVALVSRLGDFASAWGKVLGQDSEALKFVKESDVNNPANIHGLVDQATTVHGALSKVTAPLLGRMMQINRSVSALAGRSYGQYLASAGDEAKLRELGVSGEIGSRLNREQELQAARGLTNQTMFTPSRAQTPISAETPIGKTVGQYRLAYSYKQSGLIYNQVVKEAAKGNLAPLAKFLALSAPVAGVTIGLKSLISGNQEKPKDMAIDAAGALGGIPGELLTQGLRYGRGNPTKTAAGAVAPVAGEAVDIAQRSKQALAGNPKSLERYGLGLVPVAGSRISHAVLPVDKAAQAWYDAKNKALKAVSGNPEGTDAVNLYLDDNVGPKGVKIKKSPEQAMGAAEALAGSPDALDAMKKLQQSQPKHDPMWDLSDKDLKTFLKSQGNTGPSGVKGADEIVYTNFNNGEGFKQFGQRRDAYYGNNKFASTAQDNPESPTYPTFKGQQQTDYNYYLQNKDNWSGAQKAQYLQNNPDVLDAVNQVNKYHSDLTFAQTDQRPKDDVQLTPAQQTWFSWYNGLPKGSGARSQAIKGDPEMWKSISGALAQNDLTNLAKEGAVNQYQGVPFQQDFLKNALNAGKYDIQSNVPLPGGGTGYAVNTTGASSGGSGGKGGKGSAKASATLSKVLAGEKAASQARDAEHAAKAARRAVNPHFEPRAPRRLSVKIKGTPTAKPPRAKQAGVGKVYIPSIKLRSPSNKATLKVR